MAKLRELETRKASLLRQAAEPVQSVEEHRTQLRAMLATVESELKRFTAAIAEGGALKTLVDGIKERERRRNHLLRELAALDGPAVPHGAERKLQQEALSQLDEWRGLLRQNVARGRQILRKVLEGRLAFVPRQEGEDRWYEFTGNGSLDRFLGAIASYKAMASPTRHPILYLEGPLAA